jgi:hypothetical protein
MDKGGGRPDVSVILRAMIDKIKADVDAASTVTKAPKRRRR